MSKDPKDFEYKPLPNGSIRLVQLEMAPSVQISLKLGIYALTMAPCFTALSYTWGSEVRSQSVNVQGATLRITPNLESFLWEAKCRIEAASVKEGKNDGYWNGSWLWIDSICIDQSNAEEKSVQVAMMKDIYESAQTVISWLGILDDDAKLGMEYILDFDLFRERRSPTKLSKFSSEIMPEGEWRLLRDKALFAVHMLVSKSYWRRVWIIQETTTPKELHHSLVWCGSHTDNFESFTKTAEYLTRLSMWGDSPGGLHSASTEALRGLISIRMMRQRHATSFMRLYFLLPYVHMFNSTDARDKIFGLCSLVPEPDFRIVELNYRANVNEIYFSLTRNLIQRDRNLDILGFCAARGESTLPSWIPDWTATNVPKAFLRRTLNSARCSESLYSATGNSEFEGAFDEENGILYASGFQYDTIDWISVPRYYNSGRDAEIALTWQMAALGTWSNYITGCTRQEALAHTVCADSDGFNEDYQVHSLLGKRPSSVPVPDHGDDLGIFASPQPSVRDSTIQRLLFSTKKGYIGLAPYTTELGDKVCLLKGAQFPIILRPKDEYFVLVGESYIHGIMDGEGWDEMMSARKSQCEKRKFEIR